ncbi:hypothetical protein G9A89_005837 [Geosiphon pyriformis]|nr:hypothetical protein G9A89_005837 [Geosiphon pyriformis]
MFKKKTPKGAFYSLVNGSFSQKKKIVLGNIKHSDDEKNIFLVKSSSDGLYLDLNNESSCGEDNIIIQSVDNRSFLGSVANTFKAKRVNIDVILGFPFGSPNYNIKEEMELFSLPLSISLDKRWIDPKIVKTLLEVAVVTGDFLKSQIK